MDLIANLITVLAATTVASLAKDIVGAWYKRSKDPEITIETKSGEKLFLHGKTLEKSEVQSIIRHLEQAVPEKQKFS